MLRYPALSFRIIFNFESNTGRRRDGFGFEIFSGVSASPSNLLFPNLTANQRTPKLLNMRSIITRAPRNTPRTTRSFSSSAKPPDSVDIVAGPRLLRTATYRPRPSLLYMPGLRSLPLWTSWDGTQNRIAYSDPQVTAAVHHLEANIDTIRNEYQQVATNMPSDYTDDTEHALHQGTWDWHSYMVKGALVGHFAQHYPETTLILQHLREQGLLFEGTPFGYAFFSTLHGHSKIAAHSAPINFRLRIHVPLQVPESDALLRVGPITTSWDRTVVLDDSYDHAAWNDSPARRVVLLVDIWHPDVTHQEREDIVAMFQYARKQEWWKTDG